MKTIIVCSTGSVMPKDATPTENAVSFGCNACEYIHNNTVHRCNEFVGLLGKDPQSDNIIDGHKCSRAWLPLLLIENANQQRVTCSAVEDLTNIHHQNQTTLLAIINSAVVHKYNKTALNNHN